MHVQYYKHVQYSRTNKVNSWKKGRVAYHTMANLGIANIATGSIISIISCERYFFCKALQRQHRCTMYRVCYHVPDTLHCFAMSLNLCYIAPANTVVLFEDRHLRGVWTSDTYTSLDTVVVMLEHHNLDTILCYVTNSSLVSCYSTLVYMHMCAMYGYCLHNRNPHTLITVNSC